VADQHKAAEVLAELEQLQQSQSQGRLSDDDDIGLPDFVNIDKLLAATEDQLEPDAASRDLNIDVGLADFEDLIAADEVGDVDHADSGFAGQLDLVRAYIEIGDADSANHLIKEIMASDAPAHVKQEASGLSA
jgi:FimV-like protein